MSSKLTVAQLREALRERDLETKGLKAELVARLDAALEEEAEKQKQKSPRKRARKREEPEDDEDDNVKAMKKLTVAQLRAELDQRGLSTSGRKAELLERLLNGEDDGDDGDQDQAQPQVEEEDAKMVKVSKKGRGVLDEHLPAFFKTRFHVLETGDDVYAAMLNFTDVRNNNNKFYALQVLESDEMSRYCVFFRWGRVGDVGQHKLSELSKDGAICEFEKKFKEKTGNTWMDRHLPGRKNKYTMLEMDYEDDTEPGPSAKENKVKVEKARVESKLDKPIQEFISIICNINMMKEKMVEIGYDARKMPLGKLSKATILKGYEVLKRIEGALQSSASFHRLQELSSEFYTVIPHDFGRSSIRDKTISSGQDLQQKMAMVEALGEIELAKQVIEGDDYGDPVYAQYKRLKCELEPLDSHSEDYAWIQEFLKNTHGQTHQSYELAIQQIFKVEREGESSRFLQFADNANRMLLWHGSRLTNWTGILSQGLRIAPPEAPSTGYMFGKGVYFADMVSKSANYCFTSPRDPTGVLLLCEVALGEMNELQLADYSADRYISGRKLSTKGLGRTVPNEVEFKRLPDGVVVPMGKPKSVPHSSSLEYNEYIVYNTAQIRMRYVLQVEFKYKRGGYY